MIKDLKIKIYADGADLQSMVEEYKKGVVKGFTTNPSLMKNAGITSYRDFAKLVLDNIKDMPVSFEVFADSKEEMIKEANEINKWGTNVYTKIPVVDTKGTFNGEVIKILSDAGVKVNVTAVFTLEQVENILKMLNKETPAIISIFAGRIADTGVDPSEIVKKAVEMSKKYPYVEILWASCRESYNILEAEQAGCHIITVQNSLLNKRNLLGKDLNQYSIDTVNDFFEDAKSSGFSILK